MGVQGLWQVLAPVGRRVDVATLQTKTLAIDASIWLTQFVKAMRDRETGKMLPHAHIVGSLRRILKLLHHKIKPLFVFDGGVPVLKRRIMQQRRQRSDRQKEKLKRTAHKLLLNQMMKSTLAPTPPNAAVSEDFVLSSAHTGSASKQATSQPVVGNAEDEEEIEWDVESEEEEEEVVAKKGKAGKERQVPSRSDVVEDILDQIADGSGNVNLGAVGDLPEQLQYATLARLKDKRLQRENKRSEFIPVAADPLQYSHLQLKHFLKDSHFKRKLDRMEEDLTKRGGDGRKIASDPTREYILTDSAAPAKKPKLPTPKGTFSKQKSGSEPLVLSIPTSTSAGSISTASQLFPADIFRPAGSGISKEREREIKKDEAERALNSALQTASNLTSWAAHAVSHAIRKRLPETVDVSVDQEETDELDSKSEKQKKAIAVDQQDEVVVASSSDESDSDVVWEDDDEQSKASSSGVSSLAKSSKLPKAVEVVIEADSAESVALHSKRGERELNKARTQSMASLESLGKEEGSAEVVYHVGEKSVVSAESSPDTDIVIVKAPGQKESLKTAQSNPSSETRPSAETIDDGFREGKNDVEEKAVPSLKPNSPEPNTVSVTAPEQTSKSPPANLSSEAKQPAESTHEPDHSASSHIVTANDVDPKQPSTQESLKVMDPALRPSDNAASHAPADTEMEELLQAEAEANKEAEDVQRDLEKAAELNQRKLEKEAEEQARGEAREELAQEEARLLGKRNRAARDADGVTAVMLEDVKDLLRLFGLPFVESPMEAEAQCAALEAAGVVDGVVTDDCDAFLFGAGHVYKNIFADTKYVEVYTADDISAQLGLRRKDMVSLALLLGSDYTAGIKGIGVVNATEVISTFPGYDGLERFREWVHDTQRQGLNKSKKKKQKKGKGSGKEEEKDGKSGKNEDDGKGEDGKSKVRQALFKTSHHNAAKKWLVTETFPSRQVIAAYEQPTVCEVGTESLEWKEPNRESIAEFLNQQLGWSVDEALRKIKGPIDNYLKRQVQTRLDSFFVTYNDKNKFAAIRSKRMQKAVVGMRSNSTASGKEDADAPLVLDDAGNAVPIKEGG